jgi:hypothetical protein
MRSKRDTRRRTKYEPIDFGAIWWTALIDLSNELSDHCLTAKPDQLRFQTGRLFENLKRRIEASGKDRLRAMGLCYSFVTDRSKDLGYDEARRLHFEENNALINALKAEESVSKQHGYRPLTPAQEEKADKLLRAHTKRYFKSKRAKEAGVLMRLESIASFMEAQQSFSQWLSFKEQRTAWQGDLDARARATQAWILATLPRHMLVYEYKGRKVRGARLWEGLGVGTNYSGVPWNQRQWVNILKQAARVAEKGEVDCTPLERWVWWCFPVFQRHGWNWREVKEAAAARGLRVVEETAEDFRRHWMTRGLRLTGRKASRKEPPLAEFVRTVSIPTKLPFGISIWS